VELKEPRYVDAVNALLFTPVELNGIIACGNEHGDILSDGVAEAYGSLGLMHSSAINPSNGMAMFESGAGTAADKAGKNIVNPLGRILTGALMLKHIGAVKGSTTIEEVVNELLLEGWRTEDLYNFILDDKKLLVGTKEMGELVLQRIVNGYGG
jgi:3-isopropylmalate dehydrogenase